VKLDEDSSRIREKKEPRKLDSFQAHQKKKQRAAAHSQQAPWDRNFPGSAGEDAPQNLRKGDVPLFRNEDITGNGDEIDEFGRKLSSQLTGCCYTYQGSSAADLCAAYGNDCESGETPSHDSGDGDCSQDGLSFIGISFSVNTASSNPYSYQLCDQFPMENIIDRNYEYVMSMDEDGWLVGGGYKTFDYSGKMPYIDSSHTELLRIGNLDPNHGGTSIQQVYEAMTAITFPPFSFTLNILRVAVDIIPATVTTKKFLLETLPLLCPLLKLMKTTILTRPMSTFWTIYSMLWMHMVEVLVWTTTIPILTFRCPVVLSSGLPIISSSTCINQT